MIVVPVNGVMPGNPNYPMDTPENDLPWIDPETGLVERAKSDPSLVKSKLALPTSPQDDTPPPYELGLPSDAPPPGYGPWMNLHRKQPSNAEPVKRSFWRLFPRRRVPSDTPPLGHVTWINKSGKAPACYPAGGPDDWTRRKLVIVGDSGVGKTSAAILWIKGRLPMGYIPSVYENCDRDVTVDSNLVQMSVFDTTGEDCYERLRPLSYPDSHVMMIAYGIDSPQSLRNVIEKWIAEVLHFCAGLPIILVGMKADLRDNPKTVEQLESRGERPVSFKEGYEVAKTIGASAYVECSALTNKGVEEVYEAASRLALGKPRMRRVCGRPFGTSGPVFIAAIILGLLGGLLPRHRARGRNS